MRELNYESLIEDYILALIHKKTSEFRDFLKFLLDSQYISNDECEKLLTETKNWWYCGNKVIDHDTNDVIFNNDKYDSLKGRINRSKKNSWKIGL